jgi:uncharacterized SAM-binding protein YcdF (DUF218 family)
MISWNRHLSRSFDLQSFWRGLALFMGTYSASSLLGEPLWQNNSAIWLMGFLGAPRFISMGVQAAAAVFLLLYAVHPRMGPARKVSSMITCVALLLTTLLNAAGYYYLWWSGQILPNLPVPFSLVFAMAFAGILRQIIADPPPVYARFQAMRVAFSFVFCLLLFPLGQMIFFGGTDYRRPADAAVIFGARTYADGRLSDALADRMRTACDLYRAGFVSKLILSGGPGDGTVPEAAAMRSFALSVGVDSADIILDYDGLNTEATVQNVRRIAHDQGFRRVLVVSHSYHLPRAKLAFDRAGLNTFTVPAEEPLLLAKLPLFMAREVPAWWVYYFRGLKGPVS